VKKKKESHEIALSPNKNAQATLTILKLALSFAKHKPDHRI
jgi:hypothetical protein